MAQIAPVRSSYATALQPAARSRAARGLAAAAGEHRDDKVRPDDAPPKAGGAGERGGQVQCAGAEVEVDAVRARLPAEARDGRAAPGAVHVEAQQVVEEVVARRDGG